MKKSKKFIAGLIVLSCLGSTTFAMYCAQSNREAWNNAASNKETKTTLESGEEVYPNVYADEEKWNAWKESWEGVRNDFEKIALTPGKDASQVNFAWYSKTKETPQVRFVDDSGKEVKVFTGSQRSETMIVTEGAVATELYANAVTAYGLEENTSYKYQYLVDGEWSETYTYSTQKTDKFSVLYVGDPQIGASTGQQETEENTFENKKEYFARNDAYNWNETLKNAIAANPNVSFMLSAGDQINQTNTDKDADNLQQQIEYAGFLNPEVLRGLPIATTIGNHDSKSINYKNHFNNPNPYIEEVGASVAGNDYYFTYGDALFVVIDTNNYNCQTHKELIDKAIAENKDAKWKVLMFHQDIYGSGYDHSDSDGMILRTQLTSIIDNAGFDAVLQGHDHTYSRTYQISAAEGTYTAYDKTNADYTSEEYQKQNASCYNILTKEQSNNKVVDPEGCAYFEANSSTGSKFYQLIGTQQDYIAARSQSWRPTYSVIDFDEVSMTIRTYDAATNEELVADGGIATAYTIVKSINKDNLTSIIDEAKAEAAKTDVYTADSIKKLTDVIAKAEVIANNNEATSVDIASAYTSVKDAIDALEEIKVPVDDDTLAGDVNNDGKVDLKDAKIVLKTALGIKVDISQE